MNGHGLPSSLGRLTDITDVRKTFLAPGAAGAIDSRQSQALRGDGARTVRRPMKAAGRKMALSMHLSWIGLNKHLVRLRGSAAGHRSRRPHLS
jgi:hypothetical protein